MSLMDQNLVFTQGSQTGTNANYQGVTATAVSLGTYDILQGQMITTSGGTYTTPTPQIIGNASFFGEDLGLGRGMGTPQLVGFTGAGTPAAATSLTVSLQGAPDNGGGTIAGLTFVPYIQTRAIALASIIASRRLFAFDFPRRQEGDGLPRFIQLNFTVAGANFTGLSIAGYINLGETSAQATLGQYPANY
jgi:hypothetical protein